MGFVHYYKNQADFLFQCELFFFLFLFLLVSLTEEGQKLDTAVGCALADSGASVTVSRNGTGLVKF